MKSIFFFSCFILAFYKNNAQEKMDVDIYLPEYGNLSLPSVVKLKDTILVSHSEIYSFRFVFFNTRGKSYCEVYRKGRLYEKGYYESSLDTLKRYASGRTMGGRERTNIYVKKYFQPLKNGSWVETKNEKYVKLNYNLGIPKL